MKKSAASFVALNRGTFLLLGVMLSLVVFGAIAWRASAQVTPGAERKRPATIPVYEEQPSIAKLNDPDVTPMSPQAQLIVDGGFEANTNLGSNPNWASTSTLFGSSLCTVAACGTGGVTATPRAGNGWVWFDGTGNAAAENGSAQQTVTIPNGGTATLTYFLRVGAVTAPSTSTLVVRVDGTAVQTITEPAAAEAAYTQRTVDISAFANGAAHVIRFDYSRPAGTTGSDNFTVDDVELNTSAACPPVAFANPGSIAIPVVGNTSGIANPYPSNITVSGLSGTVTKVTVNLNGWNHTFPDDVDMLLVGPGGQNAIILSDVGSQNDVVNVNLTLDDAAATALPDVAQIVSGTFRPTNINAGDAFAAPAPAPSGGSPLSVFNGTAPNGTWSLYIVDDVGGDVGSLSGGWSVNITTSSCASTDFGDAPTAAQSGFVGTYPTLLADNGARHTTTGLMLGATRDAEADGQPNATATGDGADEDGVTIGTLNRGSSPSIPINSSAAGFVNAWVDFNRDGDWIDVGEQVLTNQVVNAGANSVSITVPGAATLGASFARFRLTSASVVAPAPTGAEPDGEVEDYQVTIAADNVPPIITCPANITVTAAAGGTTAVVTYPPPVATDNVGVVTVMCSPPSGSVFSAPTTTVNCTATDAAMNTASCSFIITVLAADLSLTKIVDNAAPPVGSNVVFTITVSNAGPSNATNVAVRDLLPAGLTFVSSTPSQGSYANGTGIWTVGTINSGGNATLGITAMVASLGMKTNYAQVSASDATDPDSTPNDNSTNQDDDDSVVVNPVVGTGFVVDTTSDSAALNTCAAPLGDCSLRGAINNANAAPGTNTITFDPLFNAPQTIALTTAASALTITDNAGVTITGPGANLLTVNATGNNSRVFVVVGTGANTISGMTITGGTTSGGNDGGGIFNSGSNPLTIDGCTVRNNTSDRKGGGIENANGGLAIRNSTISGNTALDTPGATAGGGGIDNSGTLTEILNSTISGNSFNGLDGAGGLYTVSGTTISNSTITNNTTGGGTGAGGVNVQSGLTLVRSSIIAGNVSNNTKPDVRNLGSYLSSGFNLIGSCPAACSAIGFNMATDQVGTLAAPLNPQLLPLADNGGPTFTHALNPASPAVDKGINILGLTTDQRGATFPRTFDDPAVANGASDGTDVGAFERGISMIDLTTALTGTITQGTATGVGILPNPAANTTVIAGPGIIQYTATASNGGPSTAAAGEILLRVPGVGALSGNPNVSVTLTNAGTTFTACTLALLGGTGCPNTVTVAPGAASPVVFTVSIGSAIPGGSTINIQANSAVGGTAIDPTPGNNLSAVITHNIANVHDLSVTKTGPATVMPGGMATYSVNVANLGVFSLAGGNAAALSNAFNFVVTDLLDVTPSAGQAVTSLVSLTPAPNFTCTPATGPLPFGGANAPNQIICTFTGAAGLAPGSGSTPAFTATVQIGLGATIPGTIDNLAAVDASGPGVRRDLNGGSQPPNILPPNAGAVSGNNLSSVMSTLVCPAITVDPPTLPAGIVTAPYNQTITASPVGGTYSFAVTSGALPTGLNLNPTTGVLSGTPTAAGTFNFTITATGFGTCTGSRAYTIAVTKADTLTTVQTAMNPPVYGETMVITATVTAVLPGTGIPQGSVNFTDGGNPIPTCQGVMVNAFGAAMCVVNNLGAGVNKVIGASYSGNTNYNPSMGTTLRTINPAPLQVTASSHTVTYGDAAPAITRTITGFVLGQGPTDLAIQPMCSTTYAQGSSAAGSQYPASCTGGVSANYSFNYINGTVTVNKKALTVTADNKMRAYGAANPPLTAMFTGFVLGETFATSGITGSPLLTTTATATSPVGTYPITVGVGTLLSANYAFTTFTNGTLTVTAVQLTVTAENKTRVFGAANPALTFTVTGFVNGEGLGVLTGSPTITTTATATSPVGSYPITVTIGSLANPNYTFTFTPGTLTVTQAATTTTITNAAALGTPTAVGQAYAVNWTTSPVAPGAGTLTGNVTVTDGTGAQCQAAVAVGTCMLTSTTVGIKTITANYPGDTNFTGSASQAVNHTVVIQITGNVKQFVPFGVNTNLAGVTITLTGSATGEATTDANGNYTFNLLTTGGSYVITPSGLGKTYEPITRTYTNVTTNITGADFVAYNAPGPGGNPREVKVINAVTTPGSPVTVPVEITSQGNETRLAFSLNYDVALLGVPTAVCGTGAAGCTITVNNSLAGRVGITIVLAGAAALTAGTRQIARVTFPTFPTGALSTPISFGDNPTLRDVRRADNNPLPALYTGGFVAFNQTMLGFEGDVVDAAGTNAGGDGVLSNDVTIERLIVLGLLTAVTTPNQYQRADAAPRTTLGDGCPINAGDVTQVARYNLGLDPPTTTGGPTTPIPGGCAPPTRGEAPDQSARIIRAVDTTTAAGQTVVVPIELDSQGDETSASYTVNFNQSVLTFVSAEIGTGVPTGADIGTNTTQTDEGKVGVLVSTTSTYAKGKRNVLNLTFKVAVGAENGAYPLTFNDTPTQNGVANEHGEMLTTTFEAGSVIIGPTAAGVTISGRVTTTTGQGLRNATVTITDANGHRRTTTTGSFGIYTFTDVEAAQTYVIAVNSRRYRFASREVTLTNTLTDVNFVGLE